MTRKAFWKSKGFWGGLGSILTGLSIIFTTGHVSTDAILAIGTGTLAVYGRVVADTPLAITDQSVIFYFARQSSITSENAGASGRPARPLRRCGLEGYDIDRGGDLVERQRQPLPPVWMLVHRTGNIGLVDHA